ncbi:MAG: hypothetical protein ACIPMY_05590 [Rickettsia endosymbiont of Pentastiridius leporinus]
MKNKLSSSQTSFTSVKSQQSSIVSEINELAKKLHLTKELKKAYEITEKKEEVLEALKVIYYSKQELTDQVKELCSNLNDNSIYATYLFAQKSDKVISKIISPYLLTNVKNMDFIKENIPEDFIKKSIQDVAMEVLGNRVVRDYLVQKSSKLVDKSPSDLSTNDIFIYEDNEKKEDIELTGAATA